MPLNVKPQPESLHAPADFSYEPPRAEVPMSLAEIYGIQYSLATGKMDPSTVLGNTYRASRGEEPEMRASVATQMLQTSNEARKKVLDDFLTNGMVDEAAMIIQKPEPIPMNMVTETAMVEQVQAQRLQDPEEQAYSEGTDINQEISDQTRALAAANAFADIASKLPAIAGVEGAVLGPTAFLPMAYTASEYVDDVLKLVIPFMYSGGRGWAEGNVEGNLLKDAALPGSEAQKEADLLWKSKTDAEFSERLNKLVVAYGEQWKDAPLVAYVALLESVFMGQKDNPQVQRILAMSKIDDKPNVLKELVQFKEKVSPEERNAMIGRTGLDLYASGEKSTISGVFLDPYVVDALNAFDIYGAVQGLAAIRRPLAVYFGNKAIARAVADQAMKAAGNTKGEAAVRSIVGLAREDGDIVPEVQKILDAGYASAEQGLGAMVQPARIAPTAEQIAEETAKLQDEYNVRFVGAQYRVTDTGDSVMDAFVGTKKNSAFVSEKAAQKHAATYGEGMPVSVVQNPSGRGWLVKIERPVNESGWYTGATNLAEGVEIPKVPVQQFLKSPWKSLEQTTARGTQSVLMGPMLRYVFSPITSLQRTITAGKSAALERAKLTAMFDSILKPITKLSGAEQNALGEVINYGKTLASRADPDETGRWLSYNELQAAYQSLHGRSASHAEAGAYYSYRIASDTAYHLMNQAQRSELLARGNATWALKGHPVPTVIGRKVTSADIKARVLLPDGRVVSPSEIPDIFRASGDSPKTLQFNFDGTKYALIRAEGAVQHGKREATHVLVKADSASTAGLQSRVIGYTEGGTRNYLGTWFVKQRNWGRFGATDYEKSPLVHGVFELNGDAKRFAAEMEEVRELYKAYRSESARKGADVGALRVSTSNRMQEAHEGMTLEKFEQLVDEGQINPNEKFQVAWDRDKLEGETVPNFESVQTRQKNGRLYYSGRGEHLKAGKDIAPLINPFSALSKQMSRMAQTAAYNNFMIREVGEWGAAFGQYYKFEGNVVYPTAMDLVRNGVWNGGNSPELTMIRRAAEAQRMYIRRMLKQPGDLDLKVIEAKSRLAQKLSIAWEKGNPLARGLGKIIGEDQLASGRVLTESEVIATMRGAMYKLALGFFNVGMVAVQGAAALSAVTIHPIHGMGAVADLFPFEMMRLMRWNKSVSDWLDAALAKRGLSVPGGLQSMMDDWHKSGIGNIGRTDPLRDMADVLGVSRTTRALNKVGDAFLMPLYEGERIGRFVAFGIARREAMDLAAKGMFKLGSDEYMQYIQSRANTYSLNMMSGMETWWQRNSVMSIPTQFMQFPVKYAEVFFGLNREFTAAEAWRFRIGHVMMYGAFGIPFAPDMIEYMAKEGMVEFDEEQYNATIYGMGNLVFNKMIEAATGTNPQVAFSATLGPGEFLPQLVKEIFSDGTPLSTAGGISYDILKRAWGSVGEIGDIWAAVIWNDGILRADEFVEATKESAIELASITRSFRNAERAWYLREMDLLRDGHGGPVDYNSDFSEVAALFGFRSIEEYSTYSIIGNKKDREQRLYSAALKAAEFYTTARALRAQGDDAGFEKYHRKAMLLVGMHRDPRDRNEIREIMNNISDRDYDILKRKNEQDLPHTPASAPEEQRVE